MIKTSSHIHPVLRLDNLRKARAKHSAHLETEVYFVSCFLPLGPIVK